MLSADIKFVQRGERQAADSGSVRGASIILIPSGSATCLSVLQPFSQSTRFVPRAAFSLHDFLSARLQLFLRERWVDRALRSDGQSAGRFRSGRYLLQANPLCSVPLPLSKLTEQTPTGSTVVTARHFMSPAALSPVPTTPTPRGATPTATASGSAARCVEFRMPSCATGMALARRRALTTFPRRPCAPSALVPSTTTLSSAHVVARRSVPAA